MKFLRYALFVFLAAGTASAATVTGVIHNGTSGKPAAGVDVILIQLQGGMNSVANTKTDAQGKYKLDNPNIGQQPMLIRAVYKGVMFHQPLIPGTTNVDVTVYDPTSDPKAVSVGSRVIVFQPDNASLLVGEEYSLENNSQPPLAYFNEKGDFNFDIPEGAQLSQVSSWGPSKMPVVQGTINRGASKYAIAYAFQPGDNGVRLSYEVPYPGNATKVKFDSSYAVQRVLLVAAPTVKLDSDGFTPAGTDQGFNLYSRDAVPAGLPFEVSVSGTAPPPSAGQGTDQQSQGQPQGGAEQGSAEQDQLNGRDSGPALQTMPNRLDSLKWILIGGFAVLFALGFTFLWRRPVAVVAMGPEDAALQVAAPAPSQGPRRKAPQTAAPAASRAAEHAAAVATPSVQTAAPSVAAVEGEVEHSLDALKDRLFRLELRHQAGTISEEEYARERGRTEQILRELLRG